MRPECWFEELGCPFDDEKMGRHPEVRAAYNFARLAVPSSEHRDADKKLIVTFTLNADTLKFACWVACLGEDGDIEYRRRDRLASMTLAQIVLDASRQGDEWAIEKVRIKHEVAQRIADGDLIPERLEI